MTNNSLKKITSEELILRDYLAADRTLLAVDRTFLSYIRTALTLFLAGVSFIKFFNSWFIQFLGWLLIPGGIITFLVGLRRCIKMGVLLRNMVEDQPQGKDFAASTIPSYISLAIAVRRLILAFSQGLSIRLLPSKKNSSKA